MTRKLAALKRYWCSHIHSHPDDDMAGGCTGVYLASDVEALLASPELREQIALIIRQAMPVDGDYYIEAEYLPIADRILSLIGGTP